MHFALIFTVLLLLGGSYVGLRLIPRTSLRGWKKFLAYFLCYVPLINVVARHITRTTARAGQELAPWMDIMLFTSYVLIGTLSVVATVVFAYDMYLLCRWLHKKLFRKIESQEAAQVNNSRRVFLQNSVSAGIVAASGGLVAYGASEALFVPEVKHIRVPIANLPEEFQGYKIAQITDLHINKPVPPTRLENIVAKINALHPDAIAITGDLSDSFAEQVQEEMQPLSALSAPDGTFFVSGNHEYYTDIRGWLTEIRRLGIRNLDNAHSVVQRNDKRLLICGVPDIQQARYSNPILAQRGSQEGDIKILLAHQPQSIYEASKVGYHLQLCGHTHGGQFVPWTYVTDWVQPYIHGLYTVENTKLYVNRGVGYWGPPLRIGAPPEITLVELIKA